MTVKEFIDLINENKPLSLDRLEDLVDINPIERGINEYNLDDHSEASDIFKLDDGYVKVHGVNSTFHDGIWVDDLDIPCEATEVEPYKVTVTKYRVKSKDNSELTYESRIGFFLDEFSDDNPPESSMDEVHGSEWYHYEFGKDGIYGLVAYHTKYIDENTCLIRELHEDDGAWWLAKDPLFVNGAWIETISDVTERMNKWIKNKSKD